MAALCSGEKEKSLFLAQKRHVLLNGMMMAKFVAKQIS